ncbi:MAG: glycosyltransferase family 39 protein [Leptospiraceae bacterium]|nr:glycosyltransferase family 39 protein [Leptospiraceae bacterium]
MKFSLYSDSDSSFFETKELNEKIYWFLLFLVMAFVTFVRIRLIDFPLERDEGEYAYMGQLILQGIPPYKYAYNMKLPGTYGMYALFMKLFGESIRGIHFGFLLTNLSTIVVLFLFVKKLFNPFIALTASSAYGVYALTPYLLGFAAHATHFVLFWSLLGIYLLLVATEKKSLFSYFWVGFFLGMGFIMKQHAVFIILFSGVYFLFHSYLEFKKGNFQFKAFFAQGSLLVLGAILPFLITIALLVYSGVFESFYYWTFQYASKYVGMASLSFGWERFTLVTGIIMSEFRLFWVITGLGFILLFFIKKDFSKKVFFSLLVFACFLTTVPGLYFREHYFITVLPFTFIYFGIAFEFFRQLLSLRLNVVISTLLLCIFFVFVLKIKSHKDYYFKVNPITLSRAFYALSPFPESIVIADYIKKNSSKEDTVAVIGSEPQIYFYSNRKSATGFIYMYPLMEDHLYSKEMQKNLIEDIQKNKPKYIVYIGVAWGVEPEKEKMVTDWFSNYKKENYELVGITDIILLNDSIYKWEDEAKNYKPRSNNYVEIFKRK